MKRASLHVRKCLYYGRLHDMSACKISRVGTTDQPATWLTFLQKWSSFRFIYTLMPSTHSHPCSWKEFTLAPELAFSLLLKNREKWTGDPGTDPTFFSSINTVPQSAGLTGSRVPILTHKYQFLCSAHSAILLPFSLFVRFRNHDADDHISS